MAPDRPIRGNLVRVRIGVYALAVLLTVAFPVRGDVTVTMRAGLVDIVAKGAPLSEVLEGLARETGMKILYDGTGARQLVTVLMSRRPPTQAVQELLEGQGLNYAFTGDRAGTGVQTLVLTDGASIPATQTGSPEASEPEREAPRSRPPNLPLEGIPAELRQLISPEHALEPAVQGPSDPPAGPEGAALPFSLPSQESLLARAPGPAIAPRPDPSPPSPLPWLPTNPAENPGGERTTPPRVGMEQTEPPSSDPAGP